MPHKYIFAAIIFTAPFIVAIFATVWFSNEKLHPQKHTNIGMLVQPQVQLPQKLQKPGIWQVITIAYDTCGIDCQQRLQIIRAAYWALGKQAYRAQDALVIIGDQLPDMTIADKLTNINLHQIDKQTFIDFIHMHPQLPQPTPLETWLIDPLGYIILRYDTTFTGNQLLIDWRKLLRISKIG